MYKVLFIDEESDAFDDFKDYVDNTTTSKKIDVLCEYPLSNLDEMIDLIIKINPDVLITDFKLNEIKTDIDYRVLYNGVNLVKKFQAIRDGFPCFIMTSFDDDAVKLSEDVNLIYIKDILHNSERKIKVKANFLEKVINQVCHYKARLQKSEEELQRLLFLKKEGKASIQDEEKIIELDHFLELSLDKTGAVPIDCKRVTNTDKLEEIILKVDTILGKIKSERV